MLASMHILSLNSPAMQDLAARPQPISTQQAAAQTSAPSTPATQHAAAPKPTPPDSQASAEPSCPHALYLAYATQRQSSAAAGQGDQATSWGSALGLSEPCSPADVGHRLEHGPAELAAAASEGAAEAGSLAAVREDQGQYQPMSEGQEKGQTQHPGPECPPALTSSSGGSQQSGKAQPQAPMGMSSPHRDDAAAQQLAERGCQTDPSKGPGALVSAACQEILRLRAVNEQLLASHAPAGTPSLVYP